MDNCYTIMIRELFDFSYFYSFCNDESTEEKEFNIFLDKISELITNYLNGTNPKSFIEGNKKNDIIILEKDLSVFIQFRTILQKRKKSLTKQLLSLKNKKCAEEIHNKITFTNDIDMLNEKIIHIILFYIDVIIESSIEIFDNIEEPFLCEGAFDMEDVEI